MVRAEHLATIRQSWLQVGQDVINIYMNKGNTILPSNAWEKWYIYIIYGALLHTGVDWRKERPDNQYQFGLNQIKELF